MAPMMGSLFRRKNSDDKGRSVLATISSATYQGPVHEDLEEMISPTDHRKHSVGGMSTGSGGVSDKPRWTDSMTFLRPGDIGYEHGPPTTLGEISSPAMKFGEAFTISNSGAKSAKKPGEDRIPPIQEGRKNSIAPNIAFDLDSYRPSVPPTPTTPALRVPIWNSQPATPTRPSTRGSIRAPPTPTLARPPTRGSIRHQEVIVPGIGILPDAPFSPISNNSSPPASPLSPRSPMTLTLPDKYRQNRTGLSPLTPPISPDNPGTQIVTLSAIGSCGESVPSSPTSGSFRKKTENDLILEIASLKKVSEDCLLGIYDIANNFLKNLASRDEIITNLDPNYHPDPSSSPKSEAQRVNQVLCRRIRFLERCSNEKDETLAKQLSKLEWLRQSHSSLMDTLRGSHEAEISSLKESINALQKAKAEVGLDEEERRHLMELTGLLQDREGELEALKSDSSELRGKVNVAEKVIAQKEGELEVAERKIKRMSVHSMFGRLDDRENAEMAARLADEVKRREEAERELDEVVLQHKADLEEIMLRERAKVREELQLRIVGDKRKRDNAQAMTWKEIEDTIRDQERKRGEMVAAQKKEFDTRMVQEERKRAELVAEYQSKLEAFEQARKDDLDDYQARLRERMEGEANLVERNNELLNRINELQESLDRDKDAIESLKASHEDVMAVAKRINERLGEEKMRNRQLEDALRTQSPLSSPSSSPDSYSSGETMRLRTELEDRDSKIEVLQKELEAWQLELKTMDEAWKRLDAESKSTQEMLSERESRVKTLELEASGFVDTIELYRTEFAKLKKQSRRTSMGISQISPFLNNSHLDLDLDGVDYLQKHDPEQGLDVPTLATTQKLLEQISHLQSGLAEANKEISLYRLDVKGYRRDIRRRDNQISTLTGSIMQHETLLKKKEHELQLLQDELNLERRLQQPSSLSLKSNNEGMQILAGKISSVKDENLQLRQKVRLYEQEYRIVTDEKEAIKRTLEQYTEQQGMVIHDLERKVDRLKLEKEGVERRVKRASLPFGAPSPLLTKSSLIPLLLPPQGEKEMSGLSGHSSLATSPLPSPTYIPDDFLTKQSVTTARLRRKLGQLQTTAGDHRGSLILTPTTPKDYGAPPLSPRNRLMGMMKSLAIVVETPKESVVRGPMMPISAVVREDGVESGDERSGSEEEGGGEDEEEGCEVLYW